MQRFDVAPWSTSLKVVSIVGTLVLFAVSYALYRTVPHGTRVPFAETFGTVILAVPSLILVLAVLYVVKGYTLDATSLCVQRLLWSTRIQLEGLDRAWYDSSAMTRSLRVFGNGGLFSITGIFQNGRIGRYRAFVTDPRQAVVLRSPSRVVVLSPADPRAFLGYVRTMFPRATVGEPPGAV
ncbi:MAG TPA: PH domain-containing protein [Candidatus Methylomirabilis sp.]|nr:PH domain-containing protein [Candidatus Methylomirabilis sp.]